MRPLASISAAIGLNKVATRGISSAIRGRPVTNQLPQHGLKKCSVQIPRQNLQQRFRRGYANKPILTEKTKRRSRGFLRWTWRLTYLSALGGLVYAGYGIYQGKHPPEQEAPDPKKKTLVVLGTYAFIQDCNGIVPDG